MNISVLIGVMLRISVFKHSGITRKSLMIYVSKITNFIKGTKVLIANANTIHLMLILQI